LLAVKTHFPGLNRDVVVETETSQGRSVEIRPESWSELSADITSLSVRESEVPSQSDIEPSSSSTRASRTLILELLTAYFAADGQPEGTVGAVRDLIP